MTPITAMTTMTATKSTRTEPTHQVAEPHAVVVIEATEQTTMLMMY